MNLITIACVGKNGELGSNNDLIWKFREDLQTFKSITMGKPMVMGLNTWISLPGLLPGRKHLVIADKPFDHPPEVETFSSIAEFLHWAQQHDGEIYVIGGGSIYAQMLPYSNKMILTEVDDEYKGDCVVFPEVKKEEWEVKSTDFFVDEPSGLKYKRVTYIRK